MKIVQQKDSNLWVTTAQQRAHNAVQKAINDGILKVPAVCDRCKKPRRALDAHHADHARPLEVEWLCRHCHRATWHQPTGASAKSKHAGARRNIYVSVWLSAEERQPLTDMAARAGMTDSALFRLLLRQFTTELAGAEIPTGLTERSA